MKHIRPNVDKARSTLGTKNAEIGEVIVDVYSSKEQLFSNTVSLVGQAIQRQI